MASKRKAELNGDTCVFFLRVAMCETFLFVIKLAGLLKFFTKLARTDVAFSLWSSFWKSLKMQFFVNFMFPFVRINLMPPIIWYSQLGGFHEIRNYTMLIGENICVLYDVLLLKLINVEWAAYSRVRFVLWLKPILINFSIQCSMTRTELCIYYYKTMVCFVMYWSWN